MFRNVLAVFLAILMILPLQGYPQTSPAIHEEVGRIAKGSIVEVTSKVNGAKKVTGRLGEMTAEGFEVQVGQGQKVDNIKVLYADVKSVQARRKGNRFVRIAVTSAAVYVIVGLALLGIMAAVGASG